MPRAQINPETYLLKSHRQQHVSVVQALCEFIDNGFGKNRGNAGQVSIFFQQTAKTLEVWDNGRGIAEPNRMFVLGTRPDEGDLSETTVDDPGRWGVGGTSMALALGPQMELHTIHEGQYTHIEIDWDEVADSATFPEITWDWVPARRAPKWVHNRFPDGSGMMLRIKGVDKLPPGNAGRFFTSIKEELSEIYSPALINGHDIVWYQSYRSKKTHKGYSLEAKFPDVKWSVREKISIPSKVGPPLTALLYAGYNPDLPSRQSGVDVIFGLRRLTSTREAFQGAIGVGVHGRLSLGGEWKRHMTTLKEGIRSPHEWATLMETVHQAIEPLLKKSEETRRQLKIAALSTTLKVDLEEKLAKLQAAVAEEDEADPTITPLTDGEGEGEGGPIGIKEPLKEGGDKPARKEGDEGRKKKESRGLPVRFTFVNEENLPGLMARATLDVGEDGKPVVNVQVNQEHPYVDLAITSESMGGKSVLNYIVLNEAVKALAENDAYLQRLLPAKYFNVGQGGIMDRARMLEGLIMREEAK